MKKTISTWMLALVLAVSAFVSCTKDGDKPAPIPTPGGGHDTSVHNPPPPTSSYFVNMKIDGVQKSFPVAYAANSEEDGSFALVIVGAKDTLSDSPEVLSLILSSPINAIGAGSYTEGEHNEYGIIGAYAPQNATDDQIFYSGFTPTPAAPFKITISQISASVVKGTFSGTYYDGEGAGTNKKVITDGEFTAKITE